MQLYNTLSKQKELFKPLNPGKVGMYVCGPTVYDHIHIGNIRAYVYADLIRRTLEDTGYEVRMIKNITDVGHMTEDTLGQGDAGLDKVEEKAKALKQSPEEMTLFYEHSFKETEDQMNILPAHFFPRATAHIKQMLRLIEELIAKGHAYEKNGNVFLDVTTFPEYGKLSGNTLENLKVGARLEEHPDKKHPWDFALWLKAPAGHLMHWPSPYSVGYPGWHIECSAMSMEYLGNTIDIHTGGEDNIFPHHEAEIVQSEGVTGKPFVLYWGHTRHLLIDGEKMSKSKGNFYTLQNILDKGYSPMDLRMLLLGSHYRSQMNFTWEALEQAKKNKETLLDTWNRVEMEASLLPGDGFLGKDHLERVRVALSDDLNSPEAVTAALDLCKTLNTLLDKKEAVTRRAVEKVFEKIFFLFGLIRETDAIPAEVTALAEKREAAREAKDFAESDRLRGEIETLGYKVEDIPEGFRLKKM